VRYDAGRSEDAVPTYWLDLFTGTTWKEFQDAGANTSGFRHRMRGTLDRVKRGDIFLCYLTGVMRWVGALEVEGPSKDDRPIWRGETFPVRFNVKPLVLLRPEHGIPMEQLEGRVAFYRGPRDRGRFVGFVRRSPNKFARSEDGELILKMLRDAERAPVARPVDPKKLARRPLFRADQQRGRKTVPAVVSVPETEEEAVVEAEPDRAGTATTRHTEIQWHLLTLGAELGLDVWVARNDRNRTWGGKTLGEVPHLVDELPTQFNEATQRTIELIDVLWLKGNSIVSAFEVECTTSVYSGLLRMSDLLALAPNLQIKLFLVAPDDRRAKVEQEILRPTFSLRDRPLAKLCGFLAFSKLVEQVEGIRKLGLASSLRPAFLDSVAEFFEEDEEEA
jgi:hypothetical protein